MTAQGDSPSNNVVNWEAIFYIIFRSYSPSSSFAPVRTPTAVYVRAVHRNLSVPLKIARTPTTTLENSWAEKDQTWEELDTSSGSIPGRARDPELHVCIRTSDSVAGRRSWREPADTGAWGCRCKRRGCSPRCAAGDWSKKKGRVWWRYQSVGQTPWG